MKAFRILSAVVGVLSLALTASAKVRSQNAQGATVDPEAVARAVSALEENGLLSYNQFGEAQFNSELMRELQNRGILEFEEIVDSQKTGDWAER